MVLGPVYYFLEVLQVAVSGISSRMSTSCRLCPRKIILVVRTTGSLKTSFHFGLCGRKFVLCLFGQCPALCATCYSCLLQHISKHLTSQKVQKIQLSITFAAKSNGFPGLANCHCLATQYIYYTSGDIEIHINFTIICFYKMLAKWLSAPWDVGSLDVGSVHSTR